MHYLILSISASVIVSLLLKLVRNTNAQISQMVFWNYPVAAILAYIFIGNKPLDFQSYWASGTWWLILIIGFLLPTVFIFMGKAAQTAGIVRADGAQRLSLLVSLCSAFLLFGETPTTMKLVGISIAFIAMICLLKKPKPRHGSLHLHLHYKRQQQANAFEWLWLLLVFFGYGVIDILLKTVQAKNADHSFIVAFILAAVIMLVYLLISRTRWNMVSLFGGIILGGLNFLNIYNYIAAHRAFAGQTAFVFTAMNVGVIILATLLGGLILRERISKTNLVGIILAVIGISIIWHGDTILTIFNNGNLYSLFGHTFK